MPEEASPSTSIPWIKLILLVVLIVVVGVCYFQFGHLLSLDWLAKQERSLRNYQQQSPLLVFGSAFLVYAILTGLSIPGAAVFTLVYGWYFGLLQGVILVSFASTTGATLAFLLSRYFLRGLVQQKFATRLKTFNENLQREGAFYLFNIRLIPAIPFFAVNVVMGLTPMKVWTYWWVSQLGMLPGTIVYVYAGASVPSLQTLADEGVNAVFTPWQITQIVIAFTLLGTFPILVKLLLKFLGRNPERIQEESSSSQP